MTRIVAFFNLKEGVTREAYERWAKSTDVPSVSALASVDRFEVFRATGLFGADTPPPYQYIEVIDVTGVDALKQDVTSETMQKVVAEFVRFADNPMFIITEKL